MTNISTTITIGREYGSGGRQIGQEVARYFGIKCYDKELLAHAADDSGIARDHFERHDEKPTNSFLYSLVMDTYSFGTGPMDLPLNHKVFLAQFDAIRKLAAEGPCVMIGRCADYALAEEKNLFSVFVHSSMEERIKRISVLHNLSESEAMVMCTKADKSRASYYNYYTDKKWGHASSYNLCVDSSVLGIDGATRMIIKAVEIFEEEKRKAAASTVDFRY